MFLNENLTTINPAGLAFTVLMGVFLVFLPRRYAIIPVIVTACYITMGQRIMFLSLNFTMMRVLVVFGWIRLLLRQELDISLNPVDKAVLWWTAASVVTYTLLWQTGEAFINRMGLAFNAVGMYFLFRCIIRETGDIRLLIKVFAVVTIVLAAAMLLEKTTARNLFSVFGGVPEMTGYRDGSLRAQGSFGHPILAGTFGASLLPLFAGLWYQDRSRIFAVIGIATSTIITFTSASSGPVMAYLLAWLAIFAWMFRKNMREIRWLIAASIVALHIIMKAPVWFIISKVNIFSGSTGYHRAYLIDRAIANLGDWWLIGTKSTEHWGYGLFDITNQYILVGSEGGLVTISVFILIIAFSFRAVGRAILALDEGKWSEQKLFWALGAALFAHAVSFMSVSYFDQNILFWYLTLAMISSGSQSVIELARSENAGREITACGEPDAT